MYEVEDVDLYEKEIEVVEEETSDVAFEEDGAFEGDEAFQQETDEKMEVEAFHDGDVSEEARFDGFNHWPEWCKISKSRSRCKYKCGNLTLVKCVKCNVFLCLNAKRNCFSNYHRK